jgi:hypothetical protein
MFISTKRHDLYADRTLSKCRVELSTAITALIMRVRELML